MMRTAEDVLQELCSLDESHRIEAKRASRIDRSVMETVCAFSNEPGLGGGYLLLGVVRDPQDLFSDAYVVEGIENPDQLQSDLASQCSSVFNRPVRPRVAVEQLNGKAVMHRSYRIHGAIQIIRYANRLEIRNPGHSIKAEEQLGEPGSETRNPRIAAVLHEVNIAETKGSGIRAMRELMLANDLLPPTFESSRRPDRFVATFLFHHFLGPEDLAWLRRLTFEPLSDEEARALVFVRELGAIDNAAYRAINRTDTLNASAHLRRLRSLDLLAMKGGGSRTYYEPGPAFVTSLSPSQADTHQLAGNRPQPERNGHHPLMPIPEEIRLRLPPPGTKPRREVVQALIQDLCRGQALSSRELAQILGKQDHKKLVRNYLSPMVAEGLLAYTIPEMENHPDQRYTAPAPNAEHANNQAEP